MAQRVAVDMFGNGGETQQTAIPRPSAMASIATPAGSPTVPPTAVSMPASALVQRQAPTSTFTPQTFTAPPPVPPPHAPPAAPAPAARTPTFGNPTYDRIGGLFTNAGVTPDLGMVSQWGTNVDDNYLRTIAAEIQRQHPAAAASTGPQNTGMGGFTGDVNDRNSVQSWLHGLTGGGATQDLFFNGGLQDAILAAGMEPEMAGDGTWRGRVYPIPGRYDYFIDIPMSDWHGSSGGETPMAAAGGAMPAGVPSWLSELMDSSLGRLLTNNGQTPFGDVVQNQLASLMMNGGHTPGIDNQLINTREHFGKLQEGMLADARGALADQGAGSLPGVEQGADTLAVGRIAQQIAPAQSQALRDVETHALDIQNESFMNAVQMATGMARDQAQTMVSLLGTGSQRQQMLTSLSLDLLHENNSWNQFVASYGLDRAQLEEDIQNGRMDRVVELLKVFLGGAGAAANGFIGN